MTITLANDTNIAVQAAHAGADGTREAAGMQAIKDQFAGNATIEFVSASNVVLATQSATVTVVTTTKPAKVRFDLIPSTYAYITPGTVASLRIKNGATLIASNDSASLSAAITATTTGMYGVFWLENDWKLDSPAPMLIKNEDVGAWINQGVAHMAAFMPGQIAQYPEALDAGGSPFALQQCDVTQRHADGSVKLAMMHIVIPSLASGASITPKYRNKATSNNTPLTVAQMIGGSYDFDCEIRLNAGGAGLSATARTMLAALSDATLTSNTTSFSPDSRYVYKGPVCTTVIIADHTTKAYDIGFEATKSVRPWFLAKFWPHDNSWECRAVLETTDSTKLQDCVYTPNFYLGYAAPALAYNEASQTHYAQQKRAKYFRKANAAAPKIGLKPDLKQLSGSKFILNYDPSQTFNGTTKTALLNSWTAAVKTFGGAGLWRQAMGATGAAAEIGLMSQWDAAMLYDGSWDVREVVERNLELAGSWQIWLRSGSSTRTPGDRYYDDVALVPALGRWQSRDAFPNQGWVSFGPSAWAAPDTCTFIGTPTYPAVWFADMAHHPDMGSAAYLITGDYYYLDQLYGQLGFAVGYLVAGVGTGTPDPWSYQSGRDVKDCAFNDQQVRANAWNLRCRSRVVSLAPDGSPEKVYAKRVIDTGMRAVLGKVASSATNGDVIHDWFFTNRPISFTPQTLGYMADAPYGVGGADGYPKSPDSLRGMAPWMHHYWTSSVLDALAVDPTVTSLQTAAAHFPKFSREIALSEHPYLAQNYIYPGPMVSTGDFPQTHPQAVASDASQLPFSWTNGGSITADNDGYRNQYSCVIASAGTLSSRAWKAWNNVLKPNVYDVETWSDGLKWAVVPRG
jgi:hypothetical protein